MNTVVNVLATHQTKTKRNLRKIIGGADLLVWLILACLVYTAVNCAITELISDSLASMFWALIAYCVLLISVSWCALSIKKKENEKFGGKYPYSSKSISAYFTLFLLCNALYFFVAGISGDDSISLSMAIINMTLYVGFAVSPEDLFAVNKFHQALFCFVKPFRDAGITWKDWYVILTLCIVIAVVAYFSIFLIACLCALLFVIVALFVMANIKSTQLSSFCKQMTALVTNKRVLIWEIGNDYAVSEALQEKLSVSGAKVTPNPSDASRKYDVIIICNHLSNKEDYLPIIAQASEIIGDDGFVIDPFVSKKKNRSHILSQLGIPNPRAEQFNLDEYLEILSS